MSEEVKTGTGGSGETPPEPKALFYVLSFIIPLVGIILGIIYWTKPEEVNKDFGKKCVLWACIAVGAWILCWIIYIIIIFAFVGSQMSSVPSY
jgi:hypothetical protein